MVLPAPAEIVAEETIVHPNDEEPKGSPVYCRKLIYKMHLFRKKIRVLVSMNAGIPISLVWKSVVAMPLGGSVNAKF